MGLVSCGIEERDALQEITGKWEKGEISWETMLHQMEDCFLNTQLRYFEEGRECHKKIMEALKG